MSNLIARLSSRKRLAIVSFAVIGFAVTVSFQNCGKVGSAQDYASEDNSSSGKNNGVDGIQIAPVTSQTANLGTKLEIPINITVSSGYSGTLKLEVKTPELNALDPGKGIKFSFDKNTINLSGETTAQAKLTVDITTLSPSFNLSMFHVQVSDFTRPAITTDISVPLQVKPVYEVLLEGRMAAGAASPEKWSSATRSVTQFLSHQGGMTIKFINMDTAPHRVHSNGGPVPHGSMDIPAGGGFYMINVPAGNTKLTSTTYCHNHEGGGQGRTYQFNVPVVVPPPPVASGNPDAKYSYIAANIFATSCNGCHSGANPPAGVNLTAYANVIPFLVPGDASASALYNAVALPSPSMPLNAPALSAAMVKNISDWINDGALNN